MGNAMLAGWVVAMLSAAPAAPPDREAVLAPVREAHGRGEIAEALKKLEAAVSRPELKDDPVMLNAVATLQRLSGSYERAEVVSRRVLALSKGDVEAYKNLALIYLAQEHYRLAELVADKARKGASKDPGVENILGMVAYRQGERSRALAHFRRATVLDAGYSPAHFNLGVLAFEFRDYGNAEKAFAQAAALDPKSPSANLSWAFALSAQRQENPKKGLEAGKAFERVLALRADDAQALCGAGWAYSADPEGWERAGQLLTKCKELSGADAAERQRIDAKLASLTALRAQVASRGTRPGSSPASAGDEAEEETAGAPEKDSTSEGVGGSGSGQGGQ